MVQQSDSGFSRPPRRCRQVGLSVYQEHLLKKSLRKKAPSELWVEVQIKTSVDADARGTPIVYRYHDPHVFPPGQEKTLMVRCPACGVWTPPNALEDGKCLDHARHAGWSPSPSALAIAALQHYNIRLRDIELLPEDPDSLLEEIRLNKKRMRKKRKVRKSSKSCMDQE